MGFRTSSTTVAIAFAVTSSVAGCYRVGYERLRPVNAAPIPEDRVEVYAKGQDPGRPNTPIGVLWMSPPGTRELTMNRFRNAAAARGCDALLDVEYVDEWRSNYARAVCAVWAAD